MSYPGGKAGAGVYQSLINLMPPHEVYIEPFVGAGGVLLRKRPAPIATIAVDADGEVIHRWQTRWDRIAATWDGEHIPRLSIIHGNGIEFLKSYKWTGRELVYCDPPYLISSRLQQRQIYRCELTEQDHEELLEVVAGLPCLVMVSGYDSVLYRRRLKSWNVELFLAPTRGGTPGKELVWMNYSKPELLHDFRYVGRDYRERQDLRRKASRPAPAGLHRRKHRATPAITGKGAGGIS